MIPDPVTLADATNKARAYAQIAVDSVSEPWIAVHTQIWSDLYLALATTVHPSDMSAFPVTTDTDPDTISPRAFVHAWRDALLSGLPDTSQKVWANSASDIAYLPDTVGTVPCNTELDAVKTRRLGSTSVDTRIATLRDKARAAGKKALGAQHLGRPTDAVSFAYRANLYAFEAWLLQRSQHFGDNDFVQADMMWKLMKILVADLGQLPDTMNASVTAVRQRLTWIAAPQERDNLATYLTSVTALQP